MARSFGRLPAPVRRAAGKVLGTLPAPWIARGYHLIRDRLPQRFAVANFEDKWRKLIRQLDRTSLSELYRMTICLWSEEEIAQLTGQKLPQSLYEGLFAKTVGWPVLDRLMRVDQGTYLPDAMLTKVDRASMSVSLEVRVPLLDHRVVEYTSALSVALKYRHGSGKVLLRKLLSRYLPPAMFERPKMGFGVPVDQWLRGALKPLLTDYLSPDRLRREGAFDARTVERKVQEHLTGRANHQYRLWTLLMWEMWRDKWLPG
jgi:asparagine synthase (glutamine-hydrolysing)